MKHYLFNNKRSLLIAALAATLLSGQAFAASITLSPTNDNRARADALTGNSETSSSDLVGNVSGTRWHRAVLSFDLSAIPDGAPITSATLDATFDPDGSGNSANTDDGTGDITVQEMLEDPDRTNGWNYAFQSFGPDQTGNSGDETPWATAGATLGPVLSSVSDSTYDPEGIAAGTPFNWGSTAAFVSAVSANLADDEILIQVLVPGLEGGGRSFVRSNNDFELTVEFIPEPTTCMLGLLGIGALVATRRRS